MKLDCHLTYKTVGIILQRFHMSCNMRKNTQYQTDPFHWKVRAKMQNNSNHHFKWSFKLEDRKAYFIWVGGHVSIRSGVRTSTLPALLRREPCFQHGCVPSHHSLVRFFPKLLLSQLLSLSLLVFQLVTLLEIKVTEREGARVLCSLCAAFQPTIRKCLSLNTTSKPPCQKQQLTLEKVPLAFRMSRSLSLVPCWVWFW